MVFSTIEFLNYFLPVVFLLYFLVPFRFKNLVLLITSLVFYAWGEPTYVFLMLGTCLSSYIHGILIGKFKGTKWAKVFLVTSIVSSVAILGFFKYADFFIMNINDIFGTGLSFLKIALPVGISFYTFQTLSYTIDVYRGEAEVQKNFIHLSAYVALFPQLVAGPIVRYTTVEEDLSTRTHSFEKFSMGATRFVLGLGKKLLIADQFYRLAETFFRGSDDKSVAFYWIYAIANALYIYFDFSAYSDMAIGLGHIFGFRFLENFNYPFISKTVAEFWRRWHISLGTWFRDYIYIPLGGNRVSFIKFIRNTLVVWFLTGFWHGAAWKYIVWGLYFFVFLIAEKFFINKMFKKWTECFNNHVKVPVIRQLPAIVSHVYVTVTILISFVIFNTADLKEGMQFIGAMFGAGDLPFWSQHTTYYLINYSILLVAAILGATPVVKQTVLKLKENKICERIINVLEPIVVAVVLTLCVATLVNDSFTPFLYYQF